VTPTGPICQSTRTNLSALRLGDHVIGTLPGEVSVLIADKVRATSPVAAANTIVVGYAQGHVGYLMAPEDWALGGYEPSVTFWGPLEAEYLAEQLADLMPAVMTPAREDGTTGGRDRLATARATDDLPIDDPAPGPARWRRPRPASSGCARARRRPGSRRRRCRACPASPPSCGTAMTRW
jgi:hypothetical protein